MSTTAPEPLWRKRFRNITKAFDELVLPGNEDVSQDREWCEVVTKRERRRIRFHDYHEIYDVPGLYESLFYQRLKCTSPSRVVGLLEDVMADLGDDFSNLRVFDVGAGNGMVGDELRNRGAEMVVGTDIIPEAKVATERDRPGVYADYVVADLTDLPEDTEERLRKKRFNGLTCVAALGFGDIPSAAFIKALDLIETRGWLAFNIKENFLHHRDRTGFAGLMQQLTRHEVVQVQAYRRYRHRVSMAGKPLYYLAMVARKLKDLPDELLMTE
jgi:predicted TPR repeat methyltransferase